MKTILLILLTTLSSYGAATYPMLSTTTSRTVTGGATNLPTLNGVNTYTGTNVFLAAGFFPANSIGMRLLWSSPTNIYLPTLSTFANPTNNGDHANITDFGTLTLPALVGTNSSVFIVMQSERTNANVTAGTIYCYVGGSTNFIGSLSIIATTTGKSGSGFLHPAFSNEGSFTVQRQQAAFSTPIIWNTSNYVDTSTAWTMRLGMATATSCTNALLTRFAIYEFPQ